MPLEICQLSKSLTPGDSQSHFQPQPSQVLKMYYPRDYRFAPIVVVCCMWELVSDKSEIEALEEAKAWS